jgi:hypothetical protein
VGCSGFLFNQRPNCFLTAGHCPSLYPGGLQVVEFNVPLSNPNGTINHPPPQDQYPVDPTSIQFYFTGVGQDWCQFGAFNNTTTLLSPLRAQRASYRLATTVPPADGSTLRITGYGVYPAPPAPPNERNQTQQTHTGAYQQKDGTVVTYVVDTTGGNSGSAVEHLSSGLVYAIHTHGFCTATGGTNQGTAIDHSGLRSALACPRGDCADCNGNGILDQCDLNCASPCGGCNVPGCGGSSDCNSNGVPDSCDIASGTSPDCNGDGVPDECQQILLYGACCLSYSPNDCVLTTSACCDALNGVWWYEPHAKCETTDCSEAPLRPQ